MVFIPERNPFSPAPGPAVPESSRVRKLPETGREARPARPALEHLHSFKDLQAFLDQARRDRTLPRDERTRLGQACDNLIGCDPWKFEPYLMDELYRELRGGDPEGIRRLRGLIRAGSWMTYPRQTPADVLGHLTAVRRSELQDWDWRLRNADPDTAKEIKENREEQAREFALVERAVAAGLSGPELEQATRLVEDLLGHAWYALKRELAARGLSWDAAAAHPATSRLFREISELRPVRDYLYHRRLYPNWAKFTRPETPAG